MATGNALGGISLAIQLSGACLKGYELITTAWEAEADARALAVQFQIEQSRLRNFVHAAGFAESAQHTEVNQLFQANKSVLLDILSEIHCALKKYAKNECLERIPPEYATPSAPDDFGQGFDSLSAQLSNNPPSPREPFGKIRRLTWSTFTKSGTETVLKRLGRYNDFLHELLDAQQLRRLEEEQHERSLELLQMQQSLQGIRQLVEAAQASRDAHDNASQRQRTIDHELENLAKFKALHYSLLVGSKPSERSGINIDASLIRFHGESYGNTEYPRAMCEFRPNENKNVWINWRDTDEANEKSPSDAVSAIEELAILLKAPKPDEFCVPSCVGYAILNQDSAVPRTALIFEHPVGVAPHIHPLSLLSAYEKYSKPSLTDRIVLAHKLAQALLYFQAVNWLHKALRSSNILLFPFNDSELNAKFPYISGFDSSRRSRFNESTTQVPREGRTEVYRHPDTQLDGPMLPYRKTFDMYSLGLILAEIAFWKPMVSIMRIEDTVDRYASSTSDIQERWLDSEPTLLASLRAEVGDKYTKAVETCLKGREAFGITALDAETGESTALTIHRNFNSMVVKTIGGIVT